MFRYTFIAIALIISIASQAQSYETAIGVRGGLSYGITAKHFIKENIALEGIAAMRWRGATITGLVEYHSAIPEVDDLSWFAGAGGHFGFWNTGYYNRWDGGYGGTYAVVGVDFIGGVDYDLTTLTEIPLNVSLDWKPQINISNGWVGFWPWGGALSVRYIIK
ncbi:MAG: hypothetical protein MRY83_03620 [Flavobacteriales bacterium]|nr:hypothetical protein [Flavobacteriales bacterium]